MQIYACMHVPKVTLGMEEYRFSHLCSQNAKEALRDAPGNAF